MNARDPQHDDGRLRALVRMAREGRVGFAADEVMEGTHRFEPGEGPPGDHPIRFEVTWGHPHLSAWLDPLSGEFMTSRMEGRITVGGLCDDTPCAGTLELRYFREARLRYTLSFEVDGHPYRFTGEKINIKPWNLPVSHTTCFGHVVRADTGRLVSTGDLYFRWHTLPAFVLSFRLA